MCGVVHVFRTLDSGPPRAPPGRFPARNKLMHAAENACLPSCVHRSTPPVAQEAKPQRGGRRRCCLARRALRALIRPPHPLTSPSRWGHQERGNPYFTSRSKRQACVAVPSEHDKNSPCHTVAGYTCRTVPPSRRNEWIVETRCAPRVRRDLELQARDHTVRKPSL